MRIKNLLLSNKIIWKINAYVKETIIVRRYNYLKRRYSDKSKAIPKIPQVKEISTILFIGTDERQDNTGFYQALCSLCENVIPFTTFEGTWGQYKTGTKNRKEKNGARLKQLLDESKRHIDIVLMQAWGMSFHVDDINKLKEQYGFKVINIDLDSRLIYKRIPFFGKQNPGIFGLSPCVDLELVSTREIVDWYLKEGVAAIYFPLASSESFYYPIENVERIYDVGFIGGNYGLRSEEVKYLIDHGIQVEARGPGWPRGPIKFEDNNMFFNQCKIVLGMGNISYCRKFFNPKLRDYDAPMSGSVYITNRTPELEHDFREDEEIVLFDDWNEAVAKIKELLIDESRMEKIRKSAYEAARSKHTYEMQLKRLFMMLQSGE